MYVPIMVKQVVARCPVNKAESEMKSKVLGQGPTVFRGTLGNVQSKDLKNCPRNSSEAKSSEDSF